MCASWNKDYKAGPKIVCGKLQEIKVINKSTGGVSFDAFDFEEYRSLIVSMVNLPNEISNFDIKNIVNNAIFMTAKNGPITPDSLKKEISILEREYLRKKVRPYVVVASLSLPHTEVPKTAKIEGATLTFSSFLPPRFTSAREELEELAIQKLKIKKPQGFIQVRVFISARSSSCAINSALDALDLIRGIWNLHFNLGNLSRMSAGANAPINKILLGPIHTLHDPSGALSVDSYWYEPHCTENIGTMSLNSKGGKVYKFEKYVRNKLAKANYGDCIIESIRLYTRALDYCDWHIAFLKLWYILEYLTNSAKNGTEVTIKRISFLFKEREYHKQVLYHLRDYKNSTYKVDLANSDIEIYMYLLKRYVEFLILFHLDNGVNFSSLIDAAEFLDLPSDPNLLQKRKRMLNNALNFIS